MADKYIYIYKRADGGEFWTDKLPVCELFPDWKYYHPNDKNLVYERHAVKDWIKRLKFLEKS